MILHQPCQETSLFATADSSLCTVAQHITNSRTAQQGTGHSQAGGRVPPHPISAPLLYLREREPLADHQLQTHPRKNPLFARRGHSSARGCGSGRSAVAWRQRDWPGGSWELGRLGLGGRPSHFVLPDSPTPSSLIRAPPACHPQLVLRPLLSRRPGRRRALRLRGRGRHCR